MDDNLRNRLRGRSDGFRPSRPTPPAPRPIPRSSPPKPVPVEPNPIAKPNPAPVSTSASPHLRPVMERPVLTTPKRKRRSKKKFLIFLVIVLVLGGAYGFFRYHQQSAKNKQSQAVTKAAAQLGEIKPTGTIRLIASGDNFTFDSVNNAAKKPDGSYDYTSMYAQVKPFFDKSDIRICNESVPAAGTATGISGFPNFNAPAAFGKGLADLGCNVINMGTNHINDKGQAGIDPTVAYWDNQSAILAAAGANRSADEQTKIRYFTVKQVKFAFLSYTTTSNNSQTTPFGVNIYNDATATNQINEARKNAQFIIVNMTWGAENSTDINPDQDRIAQALANLGADVVIGAGPHVLQPAKILNGQNGHQTLVWFSLGNFLNSQVPLDNLVGGIAVMNIDVATQHVTDPSFLPVFMQYEWTAEQKKAEDLLSRRNLMLIPLDKAADALPKSQNNTTVQAQTARVKAIIAKSAPIKIITSAEY